MNRPNDAVQLKHLDFFAEQTSGAISRLSQGGESSAVSNILDTLPATVDGGLWRDGNALQMKLGNYAFSFAPIDIAPLQQLSPTSLPITFSNKVITVNGFRFQMPFTVTDVQHGSILGSYVNLDTGDTENTVCASLATIESDGIVTDYIFTLNFLPQDYNYLRDGDIIAVTPLDTLPDNTNLLLFFEPSAFCGVGAPNLVAESSLSFEDWGYLYVTSGATDYVTRNGNLISNSFIFHAGTAKEIEIYDDNNCLADNFENLTTDKFSITVQSVTDYNTAHTDATITTDAQYVITVNISEDDVFNTTWRSNKSNAPPITFWPRDDATGKYYWNFTGVKMSKNEPAKLTAGNNEAEDGSTSYTYTAAGNTAGYTNDQTGNLGYKVEYRDNKGFSITGLVGGLSVVDGTIYKDRTYNADGTVKEEGTVVGNISGQKVTITNKSVIYYNSKTGKYSNVTLTDVDGDKRLFGFFFGNDIMTELNYSDPYLVRTDSGDYVFVNRAPLEYFSKAFKPPAVGSASAATTFTYVPAADPVVGDFSISGFDDLGDTLSVVGSDVLTAGGVSVANLDTVNFYSFNPYATAVANPQSGDTISSNAYKTRNSKISPTYSNPSIASVSGDSGAYSFATNSVNLEGWCELPTRTDDLYKQYGMLKFLSVNGTLSASISGFKDDLGTLRRFLNSLYSSAVSSDNEVACLRGDMLIIYNAALPDNPDDNSIIQFTSNPNNFSLFLANDVNVWNHYFGEFVNNGGGSYTFSASKSTVGWYLQDNTVRYHATELNGQSISLAGLRPDLGDLAFDEDGFIHSAAGGIVGKMSGSVITIYQYALLNTGTTFSV